MLKDRPKVETLPVRAFSMTEDRKKEQATLFRISMGVPEGVRLILFPMIWPLLDRGSIYGNMSDY